MIKITNTLLVILTILTSNTWIIKGMKQEEIAIDIMIAYPNSASCTLSDGSSLNMWYNASSIGLSHSMTKGNEIIEKDITYDCTNGTKTEKRHLRINSSYSGRSEIEDHVLMAVLVKTAEENLSWPSTETKDDPSKLVEAFLKQNTHIAKDNLILSIKKRVALTNTHKDFGTAKNIIL